jgi:hypothetical protein
MKPVVFLGPTMTHADARRLLDAEFLAPARQGDVLRATRSNPSVICIIDGAFESEPAVWHNEILHAIALGIPVCGAASIGALRAVELNPFGMRGCGLIFEAYRRGWIEDDDEVAVLHAPAELGFAPLTEPMVNIRATLRNARRHGVISSEDETILVSAAKRIHYKELSYERLLAAEDVTVSAAKLAELRKWLHLNRVDRKKLDCALLLRAVADRRNALFRTVSSPISPEPTKAWLRTLESASSDATG